MFACGKYSLNAFKDAPGLPFDPMVETTSELFVPKPISKMFFGFSISFNIDAYTR